MGRDRLPAGKVPWPLIASLVQGELPSEVVLGPAQGEDAALLRLGGELWAVASDPVSFAASGAGRLAVIVNANDVAVRGATPRFFTSVVLLGGDDASGPGAAGVLAEVRDTCCELQVALVGGHTEVTPGLGHSIVVGTMLGKVEGRPVTTSGLRPGDRVGLTRWAGLEGTAILLGELGDRLARVGGPPLALPRQLQPPGGLLVVTEALVAAASPHVSALHDVTEGGVGEALHELAVASACRVEVAPGAVPVRDETRALCDVLGLDPLGLLGSGALLVGCAEAGARDLERALGEVGVPLAWLGRASRPDGAAGSSLPRFERDELLKASAFARIRGVVLDLDGTLVDSPYDWPALRRELQVEGPSLIDALNGLPSPAREERWRRLEAAEARATAAARRHVGAVELLELLRAAGLATALVTNNSRANALSLLERFGLRLDVVLTRDDGLWKPSGAPVSEAVRRLGLEPGCCAKVGDSRFDLQAGREAGCGCVVIVGGHAAELRHEADLAFPTLAGFLRYLRVVL